jgi:hypothetical protein
MPCAKGRSGIPNAALHLCPHAMWVQAQCWRTNKSWHLYACVGPVSISVMESRRPHKPCRLPAYDRCDEEDPAD